MEAYVQVKKYSPTFLTTKLRKENGKIVSEQ